jgi:hypothetical protein
MPTSLLLLGVVAVVMLEAVAQEVIAQVLAHLAAVLLPRAY